MSSAPQPRSLSGEVMVRPGGRLDIHLRLTMDTGLRLQTTAQHCYQLQSPSNVIDESNTLRGYFDSLQHTIPVRITNTPPSSPTAVINVDLTIYYFDKNNASCIKNVSLPVAFGIVPNSAKIASAVLGYMVIQDKEKDIVVASLVPTK